MGNVTTDVDNALAGNSEAPTGPKRGWRSRIADSAKRFLILFIYLYGMFGFFLLQEAMVLARHDIPFTRFGYALVTAFVLAKVMLVLEDFSLVRGFERKPPIYRMIHKPVVYAAIFIVFYVIEETVIGLLQGETLSASVPDVGGGTLAGVLATEIICALALFPYFAVQELGKIIGQRALWRLLFKAGS